MSESIPDASSSAPTSAPEVQSADFPEKKRRVNLNQNLDEILSSLSPSELKDYALTGLKVRKRARVYAKKNYDINQGYIRWQKKLSLLERKKAALQKKIDEFRNMKPVKFLTKDKEVPTDVDEPEGEGEVDVDVDVEDNEKTSTSSSSSSSLATPEVTEDAPLPPSGPQ